MLFFSSFIISLIFNYILIFYSSPSFVISKKKSYLFITFIYYKCEYAHTKRVNN